MNRNKNSKSYDGFSLVELLIVVGIIGLIASMSMGGLNNVLRATKLTTAAQMVADQMNVARQTATARNLPVEVRFYTLPDWDRTSGTPTFMRGMQVFLQDGTTNPVSKPVYFPARIIISTNSANSPMLSAMDSGTATLSGYGSVPYSFFTIRANGMLRSTNGFTTANNYFMLLQADQGTTQQNFAAVQINPITAKVTILRP